MSLYIDVKYLNQIGTKMITITVNPAITITAGSSITTTYGTPLSSSAFVANYGTGTKLFSISPTIAGITINSTTGVVSVAGYVGDTNTLTTYLETVTATDSVTAFGTTTILITVNPKIVITGGSSTLTTTRGLAIYSSPFLSPRPSRAPSLPPQMTMYTASSQ